MHLKYCKGKHGVPTTECRVCGQEVADKEMPRHFATKHGAKAHVKTEKPKQEETSPGSGEPVSKYCVFCKKSDPKHGTYPCAMERIQCRNCGHRYLRGIRIEAGKGKWTTTGRVDHDELCEKRPHSCGYCKEKGLPHEGHVPMMCKLNPRSLVNTQAQEQREMDEALERDKAAIKARQESEALKAQLAAQAAEIKSYKELEARRRTEVEELKQAIALSEQDSRATSEVKAAAAVRAAEQGPAVQDQKHQPAKSTLELKSGLALTINKPTDGSGQERLLSSSPSRSSLSGGQTAAHELQSSGTSRGTGSNGGSSSAAAEGASQQ